MLTTMTRLTGDDLTAARAVGVWGVLDVAAVFAVDDPERRHVRHMAERERVRRSLGDDYRAETQLTAERALDLARVAAECLTEAVEILADDRGRSGPEFAAHYRQQKHTARRVLDALGGNHG